MNRTQNSISVAVGIDSDDVYMCINGTWCTLSGSEARELSCLLAETSLVSSRKQNYNELRKREETREALQ